ncbi:hypothetical protein CW702_02895 [Candidatus Bathyarchaeota archaeon]|nr:MAG: hypothetical protein CW702_02895 [Candidatus Bathyarchaeota archaeon]
MVELEKIEYKPISVRDLLIEMKNLSELMIDLAYSAALFNSKELAEEVLTLERHIDLLAYHLNMNMMIAARDIDDAEALLGVSMVSSSADKISDAAADIATIVLRGIGIHPIVREAFERVEEHLARVKVTGNFPFAGKKLASLEMGIDIIAIRRGRRWIIDPDEDEKIQVGDILIARGAQSGIDELRGSHKHYKIPKRFQGIMEDLVKLKDTSEIMLNLAYTSLLLNSRELAEEVQELEEYMDDLHTDFELRTLSGGFKPEESRYVLGLIRLGVATEEIADAAAEIAETVIREVEPHPVLKMAIKEAEETVTSAKVSENSPVNGKTLREAKIPDETGMWILVIKRDGRWIRPRPDVKIMAGDILIASGYAEGEKDFKRLISGENLEEERGILEELE